MSTAQHYGSRPRAHDRIHLRSTFDRASGRRRGRRARDDRLRATVLVLAAVAWLVVGCCGLLWTIAFTADPRSMVIGLAVWVFAFVAPSTLATVVACRLDESHESAHGRTSASASAGD